MAEHVIRTSGLLDPVQLELLQLLHPADRLGGEKLSRMIHLQYVIDKSIPSFSCLKGFHYRYVTLQCLTPLS